MLQRAASNAYSWWYASHVRTKQSKWLEQSLQDMGEKVEAMLKLIQEDGDSFAKRAEMYYKRRPELINFVEESYRAYRSLAERYDHISKELQNANTTLASAFPDQYQFPIDDDDDDEDMSPRMRKRFNPKSSSNSNSNIPKAPPKFPSKNIKAIIALTTNANKPAPSKPAPKSNARRVPKSGLTMSEATSEIDKLQKQILTLQTEKEFVKSSYESVYAKYCDIDEQINGTQEKISKLQDEFSITQAIEDDEARTIMAEAAIKSCNDTLSELQHKQEKATKDAKSEHQKIKGIRKKLDSFKGQSQGEVLGNQSDAIDETSSLKDESEGALKESKDLAALYDKLKKHFKEGDSASLSVLEMAEQIDNLVNKVINFESVMSSQTALIQSLRSETDELQLHIKNLEDDKANLIAGKTTLSDKLGEMENRLKGLQDSFDASSNDVKEDEGEKGVSSKSQESKALMTKNKSSISLGVDNFQPQVSNSSNKLEDQPSKSQEVKPIEVVSVKKDEAKISLFSQTSGERRKEDEEPDWQQLFKSGLESKEKVLLDEYTTILRNYKETKKKLSELEMKNEDKDMKVEKQLKELNISLAMKDEEIHSLHRKLSVLQKKVEEHEDEKEKEKEKIEAATRIDEPSPPIQDDVEIKAMQPKEQEDITHIEKKLREKILFEVEKQLKEMKNSIALKDEEIQSLRYKLSVQQKRLEEHQNEKEKLELTTKIEEPFEDNVDIKVMFPIEQQEISPVEQKLRTKIDEILEENLDFWMRFSSSFGQVQKFQNGVEDLQAELAKIEKAHEKKEGGSSHGDNHTNSSLKSEVRPIYKHLREIETELTVWLEQSEKLKEELQGRFSQLCHIQDEIKYALSVGAEDDDMKFTSFQAAKFQGEVANMQQENNKVADELQAGMDFITGLQGEIERTTTRLNQELGISGTKTQNENDSNRPGNKNRVPLGSFIFGVKPQKKKPSFLSVMQPAMMNRRSHHVKPDKSL